MKTKITEKNKDTKTVKKAAGRAGLLHDTSGDGYVDVIVKILIAVGIGVAVYAVLNAAMPTLFTTMIQNASTTLTGNIKP